MGRESLNWSRSQQWPKVAPSLLATRLVLLEPSWWVPTAKVQGRGSRDMFIFYLGRWKIQFKIKWIKIGFSKGKQNVITLVEPSDLPMSYRLGNLPSWLGYLWFKTHYCEVLHEFKSNSGWTEEATFPATSIPHQQIDKAIRCPHHWQIETANLLGQAQCRNNPKCRAFTNWTQGILCKQNRIPTLYARLRSISIG